MFQASRSIDLNGTVLIYKKEESQIHVFKNLHELYLLVYHAFPDMLAAMTEFVLSRIVFRLTKLSMKLLAKYEWRIWTLKWSLVLRLKKKMKDKYSHYFCRSR